MWGENGLCLHTPRADCNQKPHLRRSCQCPLPPHAPCRLQRYSRATGSNGVVFASTRPVQIATALALSSTLGEDSFASTRPVQIATTDSHHEALFPALCLHTPRADCNPPHSCPACRSHSLPPHAPCRLQQSLETYQAECSPLPPHAPCRLQRQKCTELQYALFRTCVESVDSFSVLNKAMLR